MSLTFDRSASSSGFLSRLPVLAVQVIGHVFSRISAAIAAEIDRRETMALLSLDTHELSDMGITRGDVEGALLSAPDRKPSFVLAAKRAEARHAERAKFLEAQAELKD